MERKKTPIPLSALMDFDSLGESSEDSDFRIEDHLDESNEEDASIEDGSSDSELRDKSDGSCKKYYDANTSVAKEKKMHETPLQKQGCEKIELSRILICCVCLGDKSNDDNEIVECDNCGVTVHEDCYGISDNESVSSSGSGSSKTSWFCEACQAGKENLTCELCPNFGGIFRETDTGKWVHLVCSLYIPGVAFRDVEKLSNVTLFEMSYSKWGERVCSLCPDQQFARTGVCIGCDAGLCRTYFHVTCAQKEGLLSEAQSEEINHADPFYAHCKLHSDKNVSKIQKRNWLAVELQMTDFKNQHNVDGCSSLPKNIWMKTKLQIFQHKYVESKTYRGRPWIPTQKMSRPLTSSASILRALSRKATLSGIDTQALAMKEAHTTALAEVHRKWHISPAFNVEYMGYYLDRNSRISSLKQNLDMQVEENSKLVKEQRELQVLYNQAMKEYHAEVALSKKLRSMMKILLEILARINLSKKLPKFYEAVSENRSSASFVDNSNIHEIDVNVPCKSKEIHDIPESLCLKCVTCSMTTDQHLLVKCDTCQLYYHLSCLEPPLSRMPKKTKVMGWQCSECDKSSSDSDMEVVDTTTPRQLRQVKGSWRNFKSSFKAGTGSKIERKNENHLMNTVTSGCGNVVSLVKQTPCVKQLNKKKEIKLRQRDATGSEKPGSQQFKQQCLTLKTSSPDIDQQLNKKKEIKLRQRDATGSEKPGSQQFKQQCLTLKTSSPDIDQQLNKKKEIKLRQRDATGSEKPGSQQFKQQCLTLKTSSPDIDQQLNKKKERKLRQRDATGSEKPGSQQFKQQCLTLKTSSPDIDQQLNKKKERKLRQRDATGSEKPGSQQFKQQCLTLKTSSPDIDQQLNKKKERKLRQRDATGSEKPGSQQFKQQCLTLKTSRPETDQNVTVNASFVSPSESLVEETQFIPSPINDPGPPKPKKHEVSESEIVCDTCKQAGTRSSIVTCDECLKGFHFLCLNPPVRKSPKARGYSWHCADCDPSESDSN